MLTDLHTFISRIPHSYKIQMPRLTMYVNNLHTNLANLTTRMLTFTKDPIPSAGIDFINSLIVRADIPYLLKFSNDYDRFMKVNKEYNSAVYSDFIRQYPIHYKNFIHGTNQKTIEYLLITDDLDIADNIPFGSNNFDDWMNVKPVTMLSNDSPDIELDIITSKLKYRKNPPFEAVFGINIIKLLMVYTKYRLLFPEEFVENTNNYPFIYKVCLVPLLEDNIRTWLLKTIYDIVILKSVDKDAKYYFERVILSDKSNFVQNGRQSAIIEIEDLIEKCIEGKVKPDEVIVSLFIEPESNLKNEMNYLINSHYVGDYGSGQYRWLEFIREYFLLSTVIGIYGLQPESNRTNEFKKLFTIITRRLNNTRFWANAGNPYVAQNIKTKFDAICDLI